MIKKQNNHTFPEYMMQLLFSGFASIVFSLSLFSCVQSDDPLDDTSSNSEKATMRLCVDLEEEAGRGLIGDPNWGNGDFPHKLMLYIADGSTTLTHYQLSLQDSWNKESYYKIVNGVTTLVKRYTQEIDMEIPLTSSVRIYAIMADEMIVGLPGYVSGDLVNESIELEEDAIRNLLCTRANLVNATLGRIYSGWTTIERTGGMATCQIICSHVASKIDVIYNVADSLTYISSPLRVKSVKLKNSTENGFFFKVRHNTLPEGESRGDVLWTENPDYSSPTASSSQGRYDEYLFLRSYTDNQTAPLEIEVTAQKGLEGEDIVYRLQPQLPNNSTLSGDEIYQQPALYLRYDIYISGTTGGTWQLLQTH